MERHSRKRELYYYRMVSATLSRSNIYNSQINASYMQSISSVTEDYTKAAIDFISRPLRSAQTSYIRCWRNNHPKHFEVFEPHAHRTDDAINSKQKKVWNVTLVARNAPLLRIIFFFVIFFFVLFFVLKCERRPEGTRPPVRRAPIRRRRLPVFSCSATNPEGTTITFKRLPQKLLNQRT